MKDIQMVDLHQQYLKIKEKVDEQIKNVVDSTAFINGPEVRFFQNELENYLDVKHVIPCGNGTDALQVAMMALDLKPGDEVITTTFTFVATAEVIALLGLTPVLVDVDPDTFLISVDAIENAITEKTKAIMPVHLFGQNADMGKILDLAEKHHLYVIEDAAQSIGSDYIFADGTRKKSGTMGDFGCTSFFPSKNLGCYGDGGAIFTNNDKLAEKASMVVNHGMKVRYYHDEIGVNSRLDSIQAAILRVKLPELDKYNDARRKAADFYDHAFKDEENIITPKRVENSTHVFHQYTLKIKNIDRSALQEHLKEHNIPAMVYYPVPLHRQKAYRYNNVKNNSFEVADKLSEEVISLPMHTELSQEQLEFITKEVLNFVKKNRK